MRNLHRQLFTTDQAQDLDRRAINELGINGFALMCQAGEAAFQEMADKKQVEKAAGRIFYLFDRKSSIDPLSDEGKRLD